MSPFDPKKPSTVQTLTTRTGIPVVARADPPPEPKAEPEAREPAPRVVVTPAPDPARAHRNAFVRTLVASHGAFIHKTLLARQDVVDESTKDVAQLVLATAGEQFVKNGAPKNVRGWLVKLIQNEVSNYKRAKWLQIERGVDADELPSPSTSPEGKAAANERWAKLDRYLHMLPVEEAEVVRCIDLLGMTLKEASKALRRPLSTVADQHKRAGAKLDELARASERAPPLRARRRTG